MILRKFIPLILFANSFFLAEAIGYQNSVSDTNSDSNSGQNFVELRRRAKDSDRMFVEMAADLDKIHRILTYSDPNITIESDPNTFIETEPNIVKGFPAIFKVTIQGKDYVPKLTIFSKMFSISIILKSREINKIYKISSSGPILIETMKNGGGIVRERDTPLFFMTEKEKRTMIFDLCSLSSLNDIPAGDYLAYIILFNFETQSPDIGLRFPKVSNTIPVRIIQPTIAERQYLNEIQVSEKNWWVGWYSVLTMKDMPILKNNVDNLTSIAKKQLEFYLLLSEILPSDKTIKNVSIDLLRSLPVPDYLLPEKESILFEVKLLSGVIKEDDAALKSFIDKYPELKWRFDDIKSNGGDFLFHKIFLEKMYHQSVSKTADANL